MQQQTSPGKISPFIADISLLLVALGWGSTFIVVKTAIQDLPPFPFLCGRFALAFLSLLPLLWLHRRHINLPTIGKGALAGFFLFLGYATQTIGLQYTTASNAGFITGLNVVIVPILLAIYHKKLPPKTLCYGIICSVLGLALMSIQDGFTVNAGDPIVLICAFCYALQIILVARFAPEVNAAVLAAFQILTVSVLSGLCTLIIPQPHYVFSGYVWFGLILTALICTSFAYLVQSKMQQFTSPTHTAIIFATEPVFSAIFAYLLAGEVLSIRGYVGAALVLVGILCAELSNINFSHK
ncbi:MAG: DMT family transporter [Peptococcaceae bacterium]|mgnify:CR=1 FL=1|nr:DMT family transporter [Peptococcaceae bacterium]